MITGRLFGEMFVKRMMVVDHPLFLSPRLPTLHLITRDLVLVVEERELELGNLDHHNNFNLPVPMFYPQIKGLGELSF